MTNLAVTSLTELSALLGIVFGAFGTILVGFYKYAQAREKDFELSRQNQVNAFDKSITKLSVALEANTASNRRIADESKERNGHLAELVLENQKAVHEHNENVEKIRLEFLDKISEVGEQHIHEQIIDKSTIRKQVKE